MAMTDGKQTGTFFAKGKIVSEMKKKEFQYSTRIYDEQ